MKLRRTLPRGREQELTRWGWGGGLPWVMSWGFLCKRDESILLALVSPAGTAHAWRQIWIIQCLILWRRRRRLANSHNRIQTPDLFITFDVTKVPDVIALLWGEQSCEGGGGEPLFHLGFNIITTRLCASPFPSSRWFRITEYWRRLA